MTETAQKPSRKQQILQALAHMLEVNPGARITTANLAKEVGVSEAALYRHFPSKAKMFEGLIEFIEATIFTRINRIRTEHEGTLSRLEHAMTLILTFAEKNPGMCRILTGDALSGETERLHARIAQFFERLETQFKQILRESEIRDNKQARIEDGACANMLLAFIEGRIRQYVRTEFNTQPLTNWQSQWEFLSASLLVDQRQTAPV
ncbi:nucleoid occlusion factor SlmA [Oceaniserpentilla sp. 4NH20-0058]|uniref:nucleoid occlusion factor SlmA n=1 Tax=Oceaniserpentilla sp. 4NH20-0058 TaxID=3127660 RepID=UPI003101EBC8